MVSTLLGHHDQMESVLSVTIHPTLPSDWPSFTELNVPTAVEHLKLFNTIILYIDLQILNHKFCFS